jgi:hypothetical protein
LQVAQAKPHRKLHKQGVSKSGPQMHTAVGQRWDMCCTCSAHHSSCGLTQHPIVQQVRSKP